MDEDEYLMLSGLQHFAFCRRQWALIHVEQQWAENYQTTAGELMHERAHDEALIEKRQNKIITRGLRISSSTLGLTGQCDVVEFHRDADGITLWEYDGKWKIIPIEYKHGEPKQGQEPEQVNPEQASDTDQQGSTVGFFPRFRIVVGGE